jgi:predicted helicase
MNKNKITVLDLKQMIAAKNKIQSAACKATIVEFKRCVSLGIPAKATINLATGAGKTRTAYKLIFEYSEGISTVLFMVPKQSLVDQTIEEFKALGIDFEYATVYTNGNTKTLEKLNSFLEMPTDKIKIVFAVYNSVGVSVNEDGEFQDSIFNQSDYEFDLAIYDECHRVAGKNPGLFTSCVTDEIVKAKNKLFMTATVKVYTEGDEDEDEDINEFSMANTNIFGEIVYSLTIFEAIKLGILCNFQTFLLDIPDAALRRMLNKKVEYLGDIVKGRHLATAYGVINAYNQGSRKIVVMYRKKDDARDFTRLFKYMQNQMGLLEGAEIGSVASDVNPWQLNAPNSYIVDGRVIEIKSNKRKAQQWYLKHGPFVESHAAVVTSTPWLKEGEDVPCIDCIVFGDKMQSGIDIIQTIGRALRWFPGKEMATIILPIAEGEANKAARSIQTIIGNLNNEVEEFQIVNIENQTASEDSDPRVCGSCGETPCSCEKEDETNSGNRWVFSEDQSGSTTLNVEGQEGEGPNPSITFIHNNETSSEEQITHQRMMETVGLKVSNQYEKWKENEAIESFVNNQIQRVMSLESGEIERNMPGRGLLSNLKYAERLSEIMSITVPDATDKLKSHIYKFDKIREELLTKFF